MPTRFAVKFGLMKLSVYVTRPCCSTSWPKCSLTGLCGGVAAVTVAGAAGVADAACAGADAAATADAAGGVNGTGSAPLLSRVSDCAAPLSCATTSFRLSLPCASSSTRP